MKKHKSPIRCADGVELVNRFAKRHATLRMSTGGDPFAPGNGVVSGADLLGSYTPLAMPEIRMADGGQVGIRPNNTFYDALVNKAEGAMERVFPIADPLRAPAAQQLPARSLSANEAYLRSQDDRYMAPVAAAPTPIQQRGDGVSMQTKMGLRQLGMKYGGEIHAQSGFGQVPWLTPEPDLLSPLGFGPPPVQPAPVPSPVRTSAPMRYRATPYAKPTPATPAAPAAPQYRPMSVPPVEAPTFFAQPRTPQPLAAPQRPTNLGAPTAAPSPLAHQGWHPSSALPPQAPGTPTAPTAPGLSSGVKQYSANSFGDTATQSPLRKPISAQNMAAADALASRYGGAPEGWRGQNLGMNPNTVNVRTGAGLTSEGRIDWQDHGAPQSIAPSASPTYPTIAAAKAAGQDTLGLKVGGTYEDGLGGRVPGTGEGDKIPAKYEPGEFVVSNDMLEKAPGLRNSLRALRADVLADKGMTVAQADAKALGYGEQGEGNVPESSSVRRGLRQGQVWGGGTDSDSGGDPARNRDVSRGHHQGLRQVELHAQSAFEAPEGRKSGPWNQGFTQQPNQGNPNVNGGGSAAQTTWKAEQAARATAQAAADAAKTGAQPFTQGATPRPSAGWTGAAENVGSSVGNATKAGAQAAADIGTSAGKFIKANAGKALGRATNFLGVLPHLAAYGDDEVPLSDKLRIGATDLATAGGAALMGTVAGAAGNVFAPVAGTVAALPGAVVGGTGGHNIGNWLFGGDDALRRNKYNPDHGIVEAIKDLASGRGVGAALGGKETPGAAPAVPKPQPKPQPTAPADAYPQANARANAYKLRQGDQGAPGVNPYHGDLTDKINEAMANGRTDLRDTGMRANDIYKTVDKNGRVSYSGYGDGSGQMGSIVNGAGLRQANQGNVSTVPGMSKEAIAAALTNPDGSRWSAQDNAPMAANLRDGVGTYAGTSREVRNPNRLMSKHQRATEAARAQTAATREGHQLSYDAAVMGHNMTRNSNLARMGFDDMWKRKEFNQKQSEQDFTQGVKGQEAMDKFLDNAFREKDPSTGADVVSTKRKGEFTSLVNAHLAKTIEQLRATGTPAALAEAARIEREKINSLGPQGLDELMGNFRRMELTRATHGNLYGSSTHKPSQDLAGYGIKQVKDGRVTLNNDSELHEEKLRYGPDGNVILPNILKQPTSLYGQ